MLYMDYGNNERTVRLAIYRVECAAFDSYRVERWATKLWHPNPKYNTCAFCISRVDYREDAVKALAAFTAGQAWVNATHLQPLHPDA